LKEQDRFMQTDTAYETEDIATEIYNRFWGDSNNNRYWLDLNFDPKTYGLPENMTHRIFFATKEESTCPHPDCQCCCSTYPVLRDEDGNESPMEELYSGDVWDLIRGETEFTNYSNLVIVHDITLGEAIVLHDCDWSKYQ